MYKVTNDFKEACEDNNVMYVFVVRVTHRIAGFGSAFSEQSVDATVGVLSECVMGRRIRRRCTSRPRWNTRTRTGIPCRALRSET